MAKRSKTIRTSRDEASAPAFRPLHEDRLWALLLALAVVAAYLPVWQASFIWDDDWRITANPCIVGPLGLKEIWTTNYADICPLVETSFWFEHALWGVHPLPYHLVNILLHAACAILLWRVLLVLRIPGAWLGAALWALHPVQVETAAWVTEMKNTQSGLFYLLTIFFFLKFLSPREGEDRAAVRRNYALTLLFAALALASKSSTVILPIVLGLCAWWIEGRWRWRNVAMLIPIALMALFPAALTLWTQKIQSQGGSAGQFARSFPERLCTAGDAIWFYLGKLIWPHPLIFIYPRWQIDADSWLSYVPLLAVIVVMLVLWLNRKTWARPWFFAFAYFVGALLPVLGLVDGYFWRYSLVGDHFQYLASMGPLALAGAGLARLADFALPKKALLQAAAAGGLLLILGTLSWQRTRVYTDIETLWADTLAQNPDCWMAHNNLGFTFFQRGEWDEAMSEYNKALQINPGMAEPHLNLGDALIQKHEPEAAVAEFQKALQIDPTYARAANNLGNVYFQLGRADDAIAEYNRALAIDPKYVDAFNDLGIALLQKGQIDEAIAAFFKALDIDPNYSQSQNGLGNALAQKGDIDGALVHYQKAVEVDPNYAEAQTGLGNALTQKGRLDEAIVHYQKALEINPASADAHNDLGIALLQQGHAEQAIAQFEKALLTAPNNSNAHYSLAYALMQVGRLDDAIAQFQEVVRLNPGNAEAQNNLAKAEALAHAPPSPK